MSVDEALIRVFPTMFVGPHLGIVLFRGWHQILRDAFLQIDKLRTERDCAFHWVRLDEEEGFACCLYSLGERTRYVVDAANGSRRAMRVVSNDEPTGLVAEIDAIIFDSERVTGESCIVCGTACQRASYFGRMLPLCERHHPDLVNEQREEGLEGVWRRAIMVEIDRTHEVRPERR